MAKRKIYITKSDAVRLEELLKAGLRHNHMDQANLLVLQQELRAAKIVEPNKVAPDVVTMNSTVRILDVESGESSEITLVFPEHADPVEGRISVVAPMGAAVLGYKVGDTVRFRTPKGERKLQIEEILYQPEAAGEVSAR